MAAPREIQNGDSIEFFTGLPNFNEPIVSLPFSVMGNLWNFQFTLQPANPYSVTTYSAYIVLKYAYAEFRTFQFDYTIIVKGENISKIGSGNVNIKSDNVRFWSLSANGLKSYLPQDYRTRNIIEFSFRFHLPEEPKLTFKLKSQDKCVQTGSYLNTDVSVESLPEDFSQLLDSGLNHDVQIKCEKHSINAHKLVLCARSEVFKAMLQSEMLEARSGVVEIQDMDATYIRDFVKYLYTGRMPELTFDKAKTFYEAGDKYAVRSLMLRSSEYMQDNLTSENACLCLALADAHSDTKLKEAVIRYIVDEKVYLRDELWLPFCESCPKVANEVYRLSLQKQR